MAEEAKKRAEASGGEPSPTSPLSSLEDVSLTQKMESNKESLKRKLMLRRSVTELVDQGIYPSLKTPPAFAEKSRQLARAKTGDLLKYKIQHRPNRQSLVQQHILEDPGNVDPSLLERQRQLKRARLRDSMNEKIAHRPGPLELVEGHILESDGKLASAIQDGNVHYNKTCEGENIGDRATQFLFDDDSTSDTALSPQSESDTSALSPAHSAISSTTSSLSIPSPPDITPLLQKIQKSTTQPGQFTFHGTITPYTSQSFTNITPVTTANFSVVSSSTSAKGSSNLASAKARIRNKQKQKQPQLKSKVIKFHEYKGPPATSSKTSSLSTSTSTTTTTAMTSNDTEDDGTPYHILLQQQQLFLQWQLEFQQNQKNQQQQQQQGQTAQPAQPVNLLTAPPPPPIPSCLSPPLSVQSVQSVASASSEPSPQPPKAHLVITTPQPVPTPPKSTTPAPSPMPTITLGPSPVTQPAVQKPVAILAPGKPQAMMQVQNKAGFGGKKQQPPANVANLPLLTNLEEMKVADLKIECKKRGLTVSGPKPVLINKLRPFAEPKPVTDDNEASMPSFPNIKNVSRVINMQPKTPATQTVTQTSPQNNMSNLEDTISNVAMGNISPPESPMDNPLSPENAMEVTTPTLLTSIKGSFTALAEQVPMVIDPISRPPSVAPEAMDMDETQPTFTIGPPSINSSHSVSLTVTNSSQAVNQNQPSLLQTFSPIQQVKPNQTTVEQIQAQQEQQRLVEQQRLEHQRLEQERQKQQKLEQQRLDQQRQQEHQQVLNLLQQSLITNGKTKQQKAQQNNNRSPPYSKPRSPPHKQVTSPPLTKQSTPSPSSVFQVMSPPTPMIHQHTPSPPAMVKQEVCLKMEPESPQMPLLQPASPAQSIMLNNNHAQASPQQSEASPQQSQPSPQQSQPSPQQSQPSPQQTQPSPPLISVIPQQSLLSPGNLVHSQLSPNNQLQEAQLQFLKSLEGLSLPSPGPDSSGDQASHEELVKQQQKQIEELKRQVKLLQTQQQAQLVQQQQLAQQQEQQQQQQQKQMIVPIKQEPAHATTNQPRGHTTITVPNGNGKVTKIQIPAQLSPAQTLQSLALKTASNRASQGDTKPTNVLFQTNTLHDNLNFGTLSQPKVFQFAQAPPNGQPFIFTSKSPPTSNNKPANSSGGNKHGKSSSMPGSPVEQSKMTITKSLTNPFIFTNVPSKDPPNYDEVIKNRQNAIMTATQGAPVTSVSDGTTSTVTSSTGGSSSVRSEAVDDLLEILIRRGELPESAAQEPPPTPLSTASSSQPTNLPAYFTSTNTKAGMPGPTTVLPPGVSIIAATPNGGSQPTRYIITAPPGAQITGQNPVPDVPQQMTFGSNANIPNALSPGQRQTPSPLNISSAISNSPATADDIVSLLGGDTNTNDLPLFNMTMDWSSDTETLGDLNLPSYGSPLVDSDMKATFNAKNLNDNLTLPSPSTSNTQNENLHNSASDSTLAGLQDMQDTISMNTDVSDWLDVIMPSTGLTPLSANAPVSFPSDPVLTPKPQDILDLFNMEESDFNTPTDAPSNMNWDVQPDSHSLS